MNGIWQDLRLGARMLLKKPGFTLAAAIALALGIGANTAIFSVVNAVLLSPLPYRDADRLVTVWENNRPRNRNQNVVNPANFMDWREQNTIFEDMAAFIDVTAVMTGQGEPEELPAQLATPNLFSILGVGTVLGRGFTNEDWQPQDSRPVILSYGLWQRLYGGDPKVIGRQLTLNDRSATIVGVLPAGFRWFIRSNSFSGKPAELWYPYTITEQNRIRRGRFLSVVARLKPEVTIERARTEMDTLSARLEQQYKEFNAGWGATVMPLREQLTGKISLALYVLFGAVTFLLLIACANVANLSLARASARSRETAIRAALGANRRRIVRQLLTESLLLGLFGGALGLLIAWWGVEALVKLAPPDLLDLPEVKISLPVLAFTFGVSVLTAVIFGLAPAFESSRINFFEALKEGGKGAAGGSRGRRVRSAFVVVEIALALALLVIAGLLVKSFLRLQAVNPGFNPQNVLTMRVSIPSARPNDDRRYIDFFKQAIARLQALPGVESAGAVSFLPFGGPVAGTGVEFEGRPKAPPGQQAVTNVYVTDANYFRAMQIPLLRGRLFTELEATEARRVVVVNETFVRRNFPNEDPLGKRVTISMKNENVPTEIIGVVGDVKHAGLDSNSEPATYWPHPELAYSAMTIVMRAKGDPNDLIPAARNVIRELNPQQPVSEMRTLESWIGTSAARARFMTTLLLIFAVTALVLAAIGIYGVMSYTVAQRTQEIGVRVALGATQRDVLKLMVGYGMRLALLGAGVGLLLAAVSTRFLQTLLFNVAPFDPTTYLLVAALLGSIALLACYLPARRAAKVDPMIALRYE